MGKHQNLIGKKFGKLTVVKFHGRSVDRMQRLWECECDCGTKNIVRSTSKLGSVISCGCALTEMLVKRNTTHGKAKSPLYLVWQSMVSRCHNPKNKRYKDYGGRGIKVSDEWRHYETFHSDMSPRQEGMTLDRKDTNKDYEKSNCRWVTQTIQQCNRRNNRHVVLESGEVVCASEAARRLDVERTLFAYHLKKYGVYKGAQYATPSNVQA